MEIVVIVVVVAIGVGLYVLRERRQKRPRQDREAALRREADRLGFTYERDRDPFAQDPPLDPGVRSRLMSLDRAFYGYPHMLRGESKTGPVMIFDVWHGDYGDGAQDASDPHRQTLAAFHLDGRRLPVFTISPHHRVEIAPGDIDLAEHPAFSERYLLRGEDEQDVRALWGPDLTAFWEGLDPEERWAAAGAGSSLVVYRDAKWRAGRDKEVPPGEIELFLMGAEAIAAEFRETGPDAS
jgi:hypothetical protein